MSDRQPKKRHRPEATEEHAGRHYCPICGVELKLPKDKKRDIVKTQKDCAGQLTFKWKNP